MGGSHFAHHTDIDQDFLSVCGVPTSQGTPKLARCPLQATQELIEPAPGKGGRHREAQKEAAWSPAHRRHVAQSPSQAFPTHGIRRVLVSKEMSPFQEPIASEDQLAACPSPKQHTVAPDANANFA